jgi:hypothetical protein
MLSTSPAEAKRTAVMYELAIKGATLFFERIESF